MCGACSVDMQNPNCSTLKQWMLPPSRPPAIENTARSTHSPCGPCAHYKVLKIHPRFQAGGEGGTVHPRLSGTWQSFAQTGGPPARPGFQLLMSVTRYLLVGSGGRERERRQCAWIYENPGWFFYCFEDPAPSSSSLGLCHICQATGNRRKIPSPDSAVYDPYASTN